MKKDDLKKGALVRLKSGGPEMVYEGESWLGDALCVWFSAKGERMRDAFSFETLARVR